MRGRNAAALLIGFCVLPAIAAAIGLPLGQSSDWSRPTPQATSAWTYDELRAHKDRVARELNDTRAEVYAAEGELGQLHQELQRNRRLLADLPVERRRLLNRRPVVVSAIETATNAAEAARGKLETFDTHTPDIPLEAKRVAQELADARFHETNATIASDHAAREMRRRKIGAIPGGQAELQYVQLQKRDSLAAASRLYRSSYYAEKTRLEETRSALQHDLHAHLEAQRASRAELLRLDNRLSTIPNEIADATQQVSALPASIAVAEKTQHTANAKKVDLEHELTHTAGLLAEHEERQRKAQAARIAARQRIASRQSKPAQSRSWGPAPQQPWQFALPARSASQLAWPLIAENGDVRGRDNDFDGRSESIYVRGHYRNGSYVRGHYRARPR